MRIFFMAVLSVVFLSGWSAQVYAENQAPFDESELNRFLSDLTDIPGLASGGMQKMEAVKQGKSPDTEFMNQDMETANTAIKKKGWDVNRFYYVFGHVMMVTAVETLDRITQNVSPQMEEAVKAIKENPQLSGEQKEQMLRQMGEGMTGVDTDIKDLKAKVKDEVPASEQNLIKSNYSTICSAMGMQEDMDTTGTY
ncbi:MAG: hypothetical protein ACQETC_08585 [Thermodesulfobacteriota bacterium]